MDFRKKPQISNCIEIDSLGAELFHADRRTNTKLTITFRDLAKAPNKGFYFAVCCKACSSGAVVA
jgi:hypothetical protein